MLKIFIHTSVLSEEEESFWIQIIPLKLYLKKTFGCMTFVLHTSITESKLEPEMASQIFTSLLQ